MARPTNTTPSRTKNIAIRGDLADKLDIHLFSELEGKVPYAAYGKFFNELLEQYFKTLSQSEQGPAL